MADILGFVGDTLVANPLLLLFLVAAIGYPLGRVKIGGAGLGVAAVLFVGLAFGATRPDMKLPELIYQMGLVLFVYTIGLAAGPGFFASLRGRGLRDNLFAVCMVVFAALLVLAAYYFFGLRGTEAAGLFTGVLTNTPALAAILDYLKGQAGAAANSPLLSDPVVAYSIVYPVSVIGMILAIYAASRLWKVDYHEEAERLRAAHTAGVEAVTGTDITNRTVRVTGRDGVIGKPVGALVAEHDLDVVFGRVLSGRKLSIVTEETAFHPGDLVTVVGSKAELERVTALLGTEYAEHLDADRRDLDFRRIFVSNPALAGHRLRDLDLPHRMGAVVTRMRRGDVDIIPHGDTVLELGDRVRVLTRKENMKAVTAYFGDSYKALSELDILSFSLGLALGLVLGMIPFPLPGGLTLKLGLAGGPLIMALVLGAQGHTGPVTWSLPYNADLMLRQLGLVLFLAGIGTRSGYDFFRTLSDGTGTSLLISGIVAVTLTALVTLWVGYKILGVPMGLLIGMLSGIQTQPATLGFAEEQAGNDLPNLGYARVFPFAAVSKILIAQLLVSLLT